MNDLPTGEGRVALIGALAGGLIVALASLGVAFISQHGENERIEKRLDEEARGAARVLVSRFATTINYGGAALEAGHYPSFEPHFVAPKQNLQLLREEVSRGLRAILAVADLPVGNRSD